MDFDPREKAGLTWIDVLLVVVFAFIVAASAVYLIDAAAVGAAQWAVIP